MIHTLSTIETAQWLLGKVLVSRIAGELCKGIIVETEAYLQDDKACHSYGNKKTSRTAPMYGPSGRAYVFLCYGIHHLLNVVCQEEGIGEAVLIRAVQPTEGLHVMQRRTNKAANNLRAASGPGLVGKAFGVALAHNHLDLFMDKEISIEVPDTAPSFAIVSGPRIGVAYAGEDAALPYRYWIKGNEYVSR